MGVPDAEQNGGNLVTCQGLVWHSGGRLVLDRLDFELAGGESLALLGGSGSGKSTLLRIIAGLEIVEQGEVRIEGRLATRAKHLVIPPHRRQLAMLFQDLALWPNLSVAGNVALGLSGLGLPRKARRRRVEEALGKCEIGDLAHRLPGTLSGGQQQRVALARALSMKPRLLLLDEPFSGLDLVTKQSVIREISDLRRQLEFSVVLVTHDPEEFRLLCDTLAVLEKGRIVDRGPIDKIASAAQSRLARAFIDLFCAARPHPDPPPPPR